MRDYCFYYYNKSSFLKEFFCTTDDNLVALYLLAKYLLDCPDFSYDDYDVPCYCMVDGDYHNFTDKEIKFFRKCIGVES